MILRALFPSWKFFDDVSFIHELMVRISDSSGTMSDWKHAPHLPPRNLGSLFLNAKGNFRFQENSRVEALVERLRNQKENIETWIEYQNVEEIARHYADELDPAATHFQFGLILKKVGDEEKNLEEVLVSREYTCD